jgi:hypothetical protein
VVLPGADMGAVVVVVDGETAVAGGKTATGGGEAAVAFEAVVALVAATGDTAGGVGTAVEGGEGAGEGVDVTGGAGGKVHSE